MNIQASRWDRKQGSATLTVLGLVVLMCGILAVMASSAAQRAFSARKLSEQVRALMYAEAGAHEAYHRIAGDWSLRTNSAAFPQTTYGIGWYDVTVTPTNDVAIIHSEGNCGSSEMAVILDLVDYGYPGIFGRNWDPDSFNYAILNGGTFDFRGCGNMTTTNGTSLFHSNGEMEIRGDASANVDIRSSSGIKISNNVTVDGDVTAPSLTYHAGKVTITGTPSKQAVPYVGIPDIDLTPFYNWANDHGEVYNGLNISGGVINPDGGVIWVQGNVHISGHAVVNGTIIATGNVDISGSVNITASEFGFALASRDGDMTITSSGNLRGLFYCKGGDFDYTANGQITGQVIAGGNVKKAGVSDVFVFEKTIPTPPGQIDGRLGKTIIGVSAWQQ